MLDPHTATCLKAYENLKSEELKCVISSTAEWSKFSPTVIKALTGEELKDEEALNKISEDFNVKLVKSVKNLFTKPIIHSDIVDRDEIESSIIKFIES
jgi:threonine synthase